MPSELQTSDQIIVWVGGETSTQAIRQTLGTSCDFARIGVPRSTASWSMLVTMQEIADNINQMKRASSRLLLVP